MSRNQTRICIAKKTDGSPCGQYAAKGTTVCRYHGAAAPQVRNAAKNRLLGAVDPLMARLISIGLDESKPVTFECVECGTENTQRIGFNVRDSLVAIRDALDRAGMAAPKQVEVTVEEARSVLDAEIMRLADELGLNDDVETQ